jgi:protein-S-isoprenylcysteine O-methyltransferase Ste14
MPGLALIFAAVAHAGYMNGPFIPTGWWTILFIIMGWFWLCIGALLWIRSVFTFGVDNLTLLYVYHPEEGHIVESSIYSILRHPIYASALRICVGLALLNGNANSVAFTIFMPLGLIGWIRLVEEKELVERFGQPYIDYRRRVPAFWPQLHNLRKFYTSLFTGR